MANPQIPIQSGSYLPSLDAEEDIQKAKSQDADMKYYEDALGLESDEVEEEVIEMEDGSVVVNFIPTKSPQEAPEFYANLAEEFDGGLLQSLAVLLS